MDAVIGQDRAVGVLTAALRSERMHHAWIFSGPPGVGKATTAVELARLALDPTFEDPGAGPLSPPRNSETNRRIDAGTHPDLHIVRKELALTSSVPQLRDKKLRNIPIDLLREQMIGGTTQDGRYHEPLVSHSSQFGHGKVFIIDEAELLDRNGQNALLKTLEEPTPGTYIILVTSRPDRLYPTVRSRCQHVAFSRLDDDAMNRWMDAASLDVPASQRPWLAEFAEGAPGAAVVAAEYGLYEWLETLDPMIESLQAGRFPIGAGQTLAGLVDDFASRWVKTHENASKEAANADGAYHLFSVLAGRVRAGLRTAAGRGDDDLAGWLRVVDLIRETEIQLASNVNMKLAMESFAAQWAAAMRPGRRDAVVV